jgi:integrase
LAGWCCDAGIPPSDFSEQTLDDYLEFRRRHTIRTRLKKLRPQIRWRWNRLLVNNQPGIPCRRLVVPPHPNVEARSENTFPATFQVQMAQFLRMRQHPDAFDETRQQQWRPATAITTRRIILRAATLEAQRRGGTQHIQLLADIVTIDAAEHILRHLYHRAGGVWREYAANVANRLFLVARDFVHVDAETLTRLEVLRKIIYQRVRAQRKPGLSESVSQRLKPFDDPRLLRRFFRLPDDLCKDAHDLLRPDRPRGPSRIRAAQRHEQGLMWGLLQFDPMRRYNLATLRFDDFTRDERGRITRLWISSDRTKNGIAIDTPIPPDLAKRIATHVNVFRPHLRGSDSPWLFPSPTGGPRSPDSVTGTLGRVVRNALGVSFPPHTMRHLLATLLYRSDPHNGVVVQRKLRHTSVKTTESMYGIMSNAGANLAWQRELASYRRIDLHRKPTRRT